MEAYDEAIERLEDKAIADKLREFRQDHIEHTRNLGVLLKQRNEEVPSGADLKSLLTKGKVVIADLGNELTSWTSR